MTRPTLVLTGLLTLLLTVPARATDYTVNANHDDGSGVCVDGECTLREALAQAGPSDRVILPPETYELENGELRLDGDTIVGTNPRNTVIEADNNARVFNVVAGSNAITAVTITGGSTQSPGGGILLNAQGVSLTVSDSTLRGNQSREGGAIANLRGTLTVVRSTITDNQADTPSFDSQGGGIYSSATTTVRNSTVSGNIATSGESSSSQGGGIFVDAGSFVAQGTTIALNQAPFGSAIFRAPTSTATVTLSHTIVDTFGITVAHCVGGPFTAATNVFRDDTCGSPVANPLLGPLENHGGPTDTHMPDTGSPAINIGGAPCPVDDQRGYTRPSGAGCDAGAIEVDASLHTADLRVVTQVVNDSGGIAAAASFRVHVRRDAIDATGSPATGSSQGANFTVPVGDYVVAGAPASGYTSQVGGACSPGGAITLSADDLEECVVTFDDVAPSLPSGGGGPQPPPPDELPAPEAGKNVNVLPKSGTVKVKVPGSNRFRELAEGEQLPVGTIVDTLNGRVTLVAAGGQTADFYGGIFRIGQGKGAKPLTTLTLVEKLSCPKAGSAIAAAKKKKRRLWGDGEGKFRTKGKHSAATVVGTKWLVEDKCRSTLTRVVRGRVSVRDFVKKKTVIVRAGKKYVAKAQG